ncbi:MAG: TolC family protein [Melioribacteraceae bacterium]|nr:TolC family protein [Melioribacteraceae bacterium]MCF8356252.1 TolC family protein [Melioribacteraceae bacterium]MCF8395428.1 TolC family protein [Melioribacteraceae bacterium]MCF8420762.1 TolC family protein [Melioribacteraceae bacterium]
MRLYRLLIVLLFILSVTIVAQRKLTLDEAINLAHQNNIELHKQSAKVKTADTEIGQAARLPNPLISYEREDLNSGSVDYSEWIASGSLPLNFIWNRWSNINSKEEAYKVEELLYARVKSNITTQVRETYSALNNYTALSNNFDQFLDQLIDLVKSAEHRSEGGDISEYELQRILLEVNKIKSTVSEIKIQKTKYANNLKLLTGIDTDSEITIEPPNIEFDVFMNKAELIGFALDNRKDLEAVKRMTESEKSSLSYNKMKIIPEMSFSAGYKEQTDNLSGTVLQFNVAVPLFERNQTGIEQAEIGLDLLNKKLTFTKEKVKSEVSESYQSYRINKSLYESGNVKQLENIFTTATYSYEQGEITLVDFIDGINAYVDGSILNTKLKTDLIQSYFRLENAVGRSLSNFENN